MNISVNDDRVVIKITGDNIEDFLQSIITQDIFSQDILYAFILTPQGKYFTDLFIFKASDYILIDIPKQRASEILQRIKIYILRKKIQFNIIEDLVVITSAEKIHISEYSACFIDPRNKLMGYRYCVNISNIDNISKNNQAYHQRRYNLLIAEGDIDLTPNKSFILDFAAEKLNAVSYNKGCYVGQELVSRMNYRNMTKKQVVYISATENLAEHDTPIFYNQTKIGTMLSSINNTGLALVKKEYLTIIEQHNDIICNNTQVTIKVIND